MARPHREKRSLGLLPDHRAESWHCATFSSTRPFPASSPTWRKRSPGNPGSEVYFLSRAGKASLPGVTIIRYPARRHAGGTHPHLQNLQNGVILGRSVADALLDLEKVRGFRPDLIYAHPGWGETLFVKEIFPDVPVIHYCEFYYHALGADSFSAMDETPTFADHMRLRMKNAVNLLALEKCDRGITPTWWQWRQQPPQYRNKISVIHDGVDTEMVRPDPAAVVNLPNGEVARPGDEVVTYVNRNLEPYRGMFTFAEAVAIVARKRPSCRFVVVGAETGHYYGPRPPKDTTYREMARQRLGDALDRCFSSACSRIRISSVCSRSRLLTST